MEAEQQAAEKPINHRRNKKRNQNMHRNQWKWKHNNPKPVGHFKKQEKHQINNLTLHLKQLKKRTEKPHS